VVSKLKGPLVSNRKSSNLFNHIPPEFNPQWVLIGWGEDVEDPTSNCELTAPFY
jgi:hypothetical protein